MALRKLEKRLTIRQWVRTEGGRDTSQRRNVKQTLHSLWEAPAVQQRRRKQTDITGSSGEGDCQGAEGDPAKPSPLGWCPLTFLHLSRTRLLVSCPSPNAAPYLSIIVKNCVKETRNRKAERGIFILGYRIKKDRYRVNNNCYGFFTYFF